MNAICTMCNTDTFLRTYPQPMERVDTHHRTRLTLRFNTVRCNQCELHFSTLEHCSLTSDQIQHELRLVQNEMKFHVPGEHKKNKSINECSAILQRIHDQCGALISNGLIEVELKGMDAPTHDTAIGTMITPKPGNEERIAGPENKRNIEFLTRYVQSYLSGGLLLQSHNATNARLILLIGPSGVGKTLCVEEVAARLSRSYVKISGGDIMSKYQGESTRKMRNLFRDLKSCFSSENRPILYFNEFDSLSSDGAANVSINQDALSMYAELNRLIDEYEGIVFLDTNHVTRLRKSHVSRAIHIKIEYPSKQARSEFIETRWPIKGPEFPKSLRDKLIDETSKYSFRDLGKILEVMLSEARGKDKVTHVMIEKAREVSRLQHKNKSDPLVRMSHFKKSFASVTALQLKLQKQLKSLKQELEATKRTKRR